MIHFIYPKLPDAIRGEVDAAFTAAQNVLRDAGLRIANDDDAERLVEALAAYVVASDPRIEDEYRVQCPDCDTMPLGANQVYCATCARWQRDAAHLKGVLTK